MNDTLTKIALGFAIAAAILEGMTGNWSACIWASIAAIWIFNYIIKK